MVWYLTFCKPRRVEAQECWIAKVTGKMTMSGKEFWVTPGTTISYSTFLKEDLTDDSYCNNGVLELPGGHKIGSQAINEIIPNINHMFLGS